jgi:hypothetical protein
MRFYCALRLKPKIICAAGDLFILHTCSDFHDIVGQDLFTSAARRPSGMGKAARDALAGGGGPKLGGTESGETHLFTLIGS